MNFPSVSKFEKKIELLLPYLADFGRVGFSAVFCIAILGVISETFYPGLVFNWVAPQVMVIMLVVFGLLSVIIQPKKISIFSLLVYVGLVLVVTTLIGVLAWRYFIGLFSVREWLTAGAIIVTMTLLIGALITSRANR